MNLCGEKGPPHGENGPQREKQGPQKGKKEALHMEKNAPTRARGKRSHKTEFFCEKDFIEIISYKNYNYLHNI